MEKTLENTWKKVTIYLEALHKEHLEVASKQGKIKYVLNLDGTMNRKKANKTSKDGYLWKGN